MADFKYETQSGIVRLWDAAFKTREDAKAAGKVHREFNPDILPDGIKRMILVNGCKTILQQRTSGLRGKASLQEIADAMAEVFQNWQTGNWEAERTGGESKKLLLVARLVWCYRALGKKDSDSALTAALLVKKAAELETLTKHEKIAPLWEKAQEAVASAQGTGDDDLLEL